MLSRQYVRLRANTNLISCLWIPPYNKELEKEVLITLSDSNILKDDTLIVVEASNDTDFDYLTELGYEIVKEKIYKTNKHVFIKRA